MSSGTIEISFILSTSGVRKGKQLQAEADTAEDFADCVVRVLNAAHVRNVLALLENSHECHYNI